jgi:hypothetical protein
MNPVRRQSRRSSPEMSKFICISWKYVVQKYGNILLHKKAQSSVSSKVTGITIDFTTSNDPLTVLNSFIIMYIG